jgi:hypothetical protein
VVCGQKATITVHGVAPMSNGTRLASYCEAHDPDVPTTAEDTRPT